MKSEEVFFLLLFSCVQFLRFFKVWGTAFAVPLPCVSIELSSRAVSHKVFSPLQSLTSVFGMGTGGPSAFVTLTGLSQGALAP